MSGPTVVTDRSAFREAAEGVDGARLPIEVRVTVADPFEAYRRAREGAGDAFLETTGGQPGWSYFGVDPLERFTVGPDAVTLSRAGLDGDFPSERTRTGGSVDSGQEAVGASLDGGRGRESPTLSAIEGRLEGEELVRGECDVPYPCGMIGWLSYDVARELEDLPTTTVDDRGLPRFEASVFDRLAAWEEPRDPDEPVTLRITACPMVDPEVGADLHSSDSGAIDDEHDAIDDESFSTNDERDAIDAAYERGRRRALELARRAVEGDPIVGEPPVEATRATFESDCGRAAFEDRVRRVKHYVREGDTFQANVSQRLVAPAAVHPVEAYDALRRVNPAPYSCLYEGRSADLVSASPELLLEREGAFLRTEPIAGTRPRGETPEEDATLEADLLADEKERAEHAMLVDLERNDLGAVSEYGSVAVEEYRRVDRYSEVMHLVSSVTGRLREDASLADAIAATFPGGTITGAPKPRTMAIIDEVEATRRGPYTGSIGIFGFDGRATLNMVIRTLVRHGEAYHLRVGAGIVHDSDPTREYEETLDKARALVTAVDEALGERAAMAVESAGDESGSAFGGAESGGSGSDDTESDGDESEEAGSAEVDFDGGSKPTGRPTSGDRGGGDRD